jgi:sporulation protein YlmC with PRC-barrel domain
MKNLAVFAAAATLVASAAAAATMSSVPTDSRTVADYYKQAVYGPNQTKVGDVDDVLLGEDGKVTGLVIGVGGFLGMDQKDVIVPFSDVAMSKKNEKWWLTIDETKASLKSAQGFTYDHKTNMWAPVKG